MEAACQLKIPDEAATNAIHRRDRERPIVAMSYVQIANTLVVFVVHRDVFGSPLNSWMVCHGATMADGGLQDSIKSSTST
jgi:hypothetical protein